MRRLVLLRHAEPQNNHPTGDKGRELTAAGVEDAVRIGRTLATLGLDYALVSTSRRTRQTFGHLGLGIPAEYQEALYGGGTETMLQRIGEMLDDVTGLLVVGHAPTIPHLSAQLAAASAPAEADQLLCWFPAGAFTEFTFEGTWADLGDHPDAVRLERVQRVEGSA